MSNFKIQRFKGEDWESETDTISYEEEIWWDEEMDTLEEEQGDENMELYTTRSGRQVFKKTPVDYDDI